MMGQPHSSDKMKTQILKDACTPVFTRALLTTPKYGSNITVQDG